ncbi:DNA polymerase III subunit alpha [Alicyclobacillus tolerans]|uniref:DNA polymerase III subunit alpha n=1 Tax=Alicyclobacillus tolerans TaxID=90970 RepID=UPI001F3317BD|nr:DNA polymerase III subunit alpha [Alicyclobacillus tolerans]MCF8565266.1 DNA polymerase III subunit alpha [Alicyclobacillus tolerans]
MRWWSKLSEFVHLHCHSPFSFLDGAATIESLAAQAAMFGMGALALTDHNTIAGLPELHKWAAVYGIKPVSGTELDLENHSHLTVLAETKEGYANLCRLLTLAYTGEGRRQQPRLTETHLFLHRTGLIVLSGCRHGQINQLLLQRRFEDARQVARTYRDAFEDRFFLEIQADDYPQSDWLNTQLKEIGQELQIPLVATSNVHYLNQSQFPVHDVLSCIRLGCDVHTPHPKRPLNDVRWLHDMQEAETRFAAYPQAIENTARIAQRCEVVLKTGESLFPSFELSSKGSSEGSPDSAAPSGPFRPEGETKRKNASHYLRKLVFEGAEERYPVLDKTLQGRLEHELSIIEELGYVDYFLVVWDIVRFARERRIRCAGRGSAADSAVAYCLYITDVDAAGRNLLFERFMSLERAEKPDIDIDFDSTRRDEVMEYVYRKYGRDHVARVATYQTFRGRSAIRDIGKALCIPEPVLDQLAKRVPYMAHADSLPALFERVPELRELSRYKEQLVWLWKLAAQVAGFPRHFGMHVGGMVISKKPLWQVTSLQPSAKGEWITPFDKDAAEEVGLVKLDLLSLRTMGAIEGAVQLRERAGHALDYDNIPLDDQATFDMLGQGDTIGVFQLESPAQRALQARLHPDGLEDIVASVALIRPGPIKGNMVDPFLARRSGQEAVSYLHPKLEPILGKTYGVVLFQEQVIEIATAIANFTPGEADKLRRVMSHARSAKEMEEIGRHFIEKSCAQGIEPEVAKTVFSYIQGYASYGFCEAHAAAFATTAYKTAYLVKHYPAEFYASILNQYPMGYYPVHVICAQARHRGISILGLDVNRSTWQSMVEHTPQGQGIRLGFRLLKGFREKTAEELTANRQSQGRFHSLYDVIQRIVSLDRLSAERLVRAGALDSLHPSRRQLLWQLPDLLAARSAGEQPLLKGNRANEAAEKYPADFTMAEKLGDEYRLLGVGTSGHWMSLVRKDSLPDGYKTAAGIEQCGDGDEVFAAGLVIRPHRPPTKSGKTVVFFTLEDETGWIDATMFEDVYQNCGALLFTPYGRLIGVKGKVQRRNSSKAGIVVDFVWPL